MVAGSGGQLGWRTLGISTATPPLLSTGPRDANRMKRVNRVRAKYAATAMVESKGFINDHCRGRTGGRNADRLGGSDDLFHHDSSDRGRGDEPQGGPSLRRRQAVRRQLL